MNLMRERDAEGDASDTDSADAETIATGRELLKEALYTDSEIDKALRPAAEIGEEQDANAQSAWCSHGKGTKEPVNGGLTGNLLNWENEDVDVSQPELATQGFIERCFSTTEEEVDVGLQKEEVLGFVKEGEDHVEGISTEQEAGWSVSQIPETFYSTAELNAVFEGVNEGSTVAVQGGLFKEEVVGGVGEADLRMKMNDGNCKKTADQAAGWSVSRIPLTFCSTTELREAFR